MDLYYYDKYETKVQYRARYKGGTNHYDIKEGEGITGRAGYRVNNDTGVFSMTGITRTIVAGRDPNGLVVYSSIDTTSVVSHMLVKNSGINTDYAERVQEIVSEEYRVRGSFMETIVAKDGEYPDDGQRNGYWYVKRSKVGMNLHPRIDGQVKPVEYGKARIDGQMKDILGVWTKIDGKLKGV